MYDTGDKDKKSSLLSDHAVAFWTVVSGLVAVVTLVVTLVTLRSGSGGGSGSNPPPSGPSSSVTPSPSPTTSPSPSSSAIYFQYSGVSPYPCSDQNTIHSVAGGSEVSLVFVNQTPETVNIDWITGGGARETYDTLGSGGSYSVNTYIGHVWLITDYQADCLDYFYVNGGGDIIVK